MARANLSIFLGTSLLLAGCGDKEQDKENVRADDAQPTPAVPGPEPGPAPQPEAKPTPPPPQKHQAPCGVRWSDGRSLDFTYDGPKVQVTFDSNGDGQNDSCGAYERNDAGRMTSLSVDHGCDGKTDTTLSVEYDEDVNLATAKESGRRGKTFTMVSLPTFAGIHPGYLLEGDRKAFDIQVEDGLVRTVRATKGPRAQRKTTTFVYGAEGRLAALQEDIGGNGSIEVSYGYHYDAAGNVVGLTSVAGERRAEASFDYECK